MNLEEIILGNLVHDEEFSRKVLPYLLKEYFSERKTKITFELVDDYIKKYNNIPSKQALCVDLENLAISEDEFNDSKDLILSLKQSEKDIEWLIEKTEDFCKEKALFNALLECVKIKDDKSGKYNKQAIPKILQDALAVSFDTHIGHDFLEDYMSRFDLYHKKEKKIPFDLDYFNRITKGGISTKTLNIAISGTGGGKTLFMCHHAAHCLLEGYNVLYITLEMAEERIAERIDANLMNINLNDMEVVPKDIYVNKINELSKKTNGKLIIKEYPTASAGASHFRHLINELKIKKDFIPDIIFIDYLNICMSSRLRNAPNINSYNYVKAIAEELRGLAVECEVPIFTGSQLNRDGLTNSDPGLENTSDSLGTAMTADFIFTIVSSDELDELGQVMIKQLKNRYNDLNFHKKFVVGLDKAKMKFHNVEQRAQDLIDDIPVIESGNYLLKAKERKFDEFNFGE